MFHAGDVVVKPSVGLCKIHGIRRMEIEARVEDFYVIHSGEVEVLVPRKQADQGALRAPMSEPQLQEVYAALEAPFRPFAIEQGDDLPEEYQYSALELKEVLRRRTPLELVDVIRALYNKEQDHVLDKKESQCLLQAMNMLVEEIAYLEKTTKGRSKIQMNKLLAAGRKEGRRQKAAEDL